MAGNPEVQDKAEGERSMKAAQVSIGDSIKVNGAWCTVKKIEKVGGVYKIHFQTPGGTKGVVSKKGGDNIEVE